MSESMHRSQVSFSSADHLTRVSSKNGELFNAILRNGHIPSAWK